METVEDLLEACGGLGRFQILISFIMRFSVPSIAWSLLYMSVGGKVPEWFCETSDWSPQENQTVMENSTSFQACSVNGTSCERYRYLDEHTWTVMKEWNLVCDLKWVKAMVTSIQMGGVLVGAALFGQLSDRYGRKQSFFLSVLLMALSNIGTAFSVNWQMFAVGRFFIGAGLGGKITTNLIYAVEFLPAKWRAGLSLLPDFHVSTLTFALLVYLVPNWFHFHLISGISIVPVLLTYLFLPESPRWLAIQGRVDEAVQSLHKVARMNRKKLPPNTREILQRIASAEQGQKHSKGKHKYSYLDLFKSWKLARLTVTLCYFWFTLALVFYGISFGISGLSGNIYVNLCIMAVLDVPILLPAFFLVNWIGRRWMFMVFAGMPGSFAFACLGLHLTVSEENRASYVNYLSLAAKASSALTWSVTQPWTNELYPTVIRNVGYGAGNSIARVGSILGPILIDFDESVIQTYTLIGVLCILMVILAFTVEETKGKVMADTIQKEHKLEVKVEEAELDESDVGKSSLLAKDKNGCSKV